MAPSSLAANKANMHIPYLLQIASFLCVVSVISSGMDSSSSFLNALTSVPLTEAPTAALNSLDVTWRVEPAIVISESGALLVLNEDLRQGQRIAGWTLEIFCQPGPDVAQCNGNGYWKQLLHGTTVGPKTMDKISDQNRSWAVSAIRIHITAGYTGGPPPRLASATLFRMTAQTPTVAVPTPAQLRFQQRSLGALISYGIETYVPKGGLAGCTLGGGVPAPLPLSTFAPTKIDTDQWVEAVAAFGGKHATLVVGELFGFMTYPSNVSNYTIREAGYPGGSTDIVADFVRSCHARGVLPGIFYSTHFDYYHDVCDFKVDTPGRDGHTQAEYNAVAAAQIEELFSRYGDMAELWLDGGFDNRSNPLVYPTVRGVVSRADAVCHSCVGQQNEVFTPDIPNRIRWAAANEDASCPYPLWAANHNCEQDLSGGEPYGRYYCPPEGDTVLRQHYW